MIFRDDIRFEGFDAAQWASLLDLLRPDTRGRQGTLLIAVDEARRVLNAVVLGRGPVTLESPVSAGVDLRGLCREHGVARAILTVEGAFEEIAERLALGWLAASREAHALHADPGASHAWNHDLMQFLALLRAVREVEAAGWLSTWPPLPGAPLPTSSTVRRAFDLLLPVGHSFALVLYDDNEVATGVALSRRRDGIDQVVGPERLLAWAGPLSGDYHRDHRALAHGIGTHLAPLHLGVYGQRRTLERLLRVPDPGAWVTAVAAREILVHPTPTYVAVALGADALRSFTRATSELLGGTELLTLFRPLGQALRERIPEATSLSETLGWNPLATLARALRPSSAGQREEPKGGSSRGTPQGSESP